MNFNLFALVWVFFLFSKNLHGWNANCKYGCNQGLEGEISELFDYAFNEKFYEGIKIRNNRGKYLPSTYFEKLEYTPPEKYCVNMAYYGHSYNPKYIKLAKAIKWEIWFGSAHRIVYPPSYETDKFDYIYDNLTTIYPLSNPIEALALCTQYKKDLDDAWINAKATYGSAIAFTQNSLHRFENLDKEKMWRCCEEHFDSDGGLPPCRSVFETQANEVEMALYYLKQDLEEADQTYEASVSNIEWFEEEVSSYSREVYKFCAENHQWKGAYYNNGLLNFYQGRFEEALDEIDGFIALSTKDKSADLFPSDFYLNTGMIESYAGQYHDAILSLNTAIKIDPYNKEAYFERAVAYYEQGDINQALSDYLASDVKSSDFSDESFSMEYASGLYEGLKRGMHEEINNGSLISIPLSTLAFWTVLKGVEISPWYVKATLGCVGAVGTGLLANEITTELKEIVTTWDQLEQKERGDLLGYIIGKHGIEIFTAYGSAKCMKAYQNLRKANNALNFESSLLDKVGAQSIKTRLKGIEKYQKDRDYIQKTFGRHTYPEHEIRDHLQKMGYDIAKRPAGIPDNYLTRFTKKECGISYIHPKGAMVEEIRIMPGNINSPNPAQQQKYVTHLRNGEAKTVNGENINRKSKDAHIPVDEYIYIPLK